jgi:NAD(P)-dependent dehydrogenase (short-subunit alcohol dehydrogenase family)
VVVVSTASRGLGLEFCKQLLERTPAQVVALHRPANTGELEQLQQQHDRLRMVSVDLEDQVAVEAAGIAIRGMHSRVDLLLNVAGILGDGKSPATPGPERSITGIDREWLTKTFDVRLLSEGHQGQ